jgi:hypothetical protein
MRMSKKLLSANRVSRGGSVRVLGGIAMREA